MYDRKQRSALVTGASRGIGRAIAALLASRGMNLTLTCARSQDELICFARSLEETYGVSATPVPCDMSDPDAVRHLFDSIGHLDMLVNNAGISVTGLLQDLSDGEWNRLVGSNLSSVFYACRSAIPLFLANDPADSCGGGTPAADSVLSFSDPGRLSGIGPVRGRILNISSVWGNVGASCEAAYSATKGGINALTRALAKELAPSAVPVNAIACGCVDTAMNDNLSAEEKEALAQEIPAGRFASAAEIARSALSLLSAPAYLTGQIVTVDGGWI